MGPPGGGRNPITPRIMRHFNYLAFTELEDASKAKIFSTIVHWWLRKFFIITIIINCTIRLSLLDWRCEISSYANVGDISSRRGIDYNGETY